MSFLNEPGDLAQTPLAAVLLEALNLRATGVLTIETDAGTTRLYLRAGVPVGAQVFTGFKPLGQLLLQKGRIDMQSLTQSLSVMAQTGKPQGEILVELGAINREMLEQALAEQQGGYVAQISTMERGAFLFDPNMVIPAWTEGVRLSPLRAILDALDKPQARALVAAALQQAGEKPIVLTGGGSSPVADVFGLSDAEAAFARRCEQPVRIEQLLAAPPVNSERARAMLAALLLLGLAEPTTPSAAPPTLQVVAPAPAVPKPSSPLLSRQSDPVEARQRRQRLLARAMQNMGIGPLMSDASRSSSAFAGDSRRPEEPAGSPPAARTAPSPGDVELREALVLAMPRIQEKNLFLRLGLSRTASRDEVKQSYLLLAKQFHPDRFVAPSLSDLSPMVKDLFTSINEAYETLVDDKKRADYLARLTVKGPSGRAGADAQLDFKKGEACMKARDFTRARGFLEAALRVDPSPEVQATLAWALLLDPKAPDRARAKELVDSALRDRKCDRALYVAGVVARAEGDEVRAEALFRQAAKANPSNFDATREVLRYDAKR